MHQPVQDRIRCRRVLHQTMPLIYRELADHYRAALPVTILHDFKQIIALRRRQRLQSQIVKYQYLHFLQVFQMLQPAAVNSPLRQQFQQTTCTPVLNASTERCVFAGTPVRPGHSRPSFSRNPSGPLSARFFCA